MFVASISPAIVANYLFDRSLLAGMVVAARRLGDLARGDLTSAARAVSRRDEVGDLLRSTEVAGDNIVQTVREIRAAAETLTDSAARVEETVDGVAQGARSQDAVHRARTTMADIVALARLLVADMRQIAEGLAAQRQGSGDISRAVDKMASGAGENSGAAQRLAGTARDLAGTAAQLRQSVGVFRV